MSDMSWGFLFGALTALLFVGFVVTTEPKKYDVVDVELSCYHAFQEAPASTSAQEVCNLTIEELKERDARSN